MSAGTGVRHSEYNARRDQPLHLVQMWIVPGKLGTAPSYGEMAFDEEARRNRWLDVVSGQRDVNAPIRITQNATFKVARLDGCTVKHEFAPKRYGFLFLAAGSAKVNGAWLQAGDAVKCYDVPSLDLSGAGEVVLWDLPDASAA
jgi:redox-sensitive bicupin YhaK (pirin superfamily)